MAQQSQDSAIYDAVELLTDNGFDGVAEAELTALLDCCADLETEDGRRAVVRTGYLPQRTVQTGVGD